MVMYPAHILFFEETEKGRKGDTLWRTKMNERTIERRWWCWLAGGWRIDCEFTMKINPENLTLVLLLLLLFQLLLLLLLLDGHAIYMWIGIHGMAEWLKSWLQQDRELQPGHRMLTNDKLVRYGTSSSFAALVFPHLLLLQFEKLNSITIIVQSKQCCCWYVSDNNRGGGGEWHIVVQQQQLTKQFQLQTRTGIPVRPSLLLLLLSYICP